MPVSDASAALADATAMLSSGGRSFEGDSLFRILADTMPQMVWSTRPDGHHDYFNARWYEFTGVPAGSTDGAGWNGMFHPEDRDRAWAVWQHSLATGEPYEIEYRLRDRNGAYRWVMGRALPVRDSDGAIMRWVGTCTDVHDQKMQAAENELLLRELSHRIKNIFSVINGIIGFCARAQPEAASFAQDLKARIAALGRAHDLARPHSPASLPTVGANTLHGLLRALFSPYEFAASGRLVLTGEDLPVDDRGATPIAMLIHELATNAAKYGAMATEDGHIFIDTEVKDGLLTLHWREQGGPPLPGPPERVGFGTQLADVAVRKQMGGELDYDWAGDGLRVMVCVRADRLSRGN